MIVFYYRDEAPVGTEIIEVLGFSYDPRGLGLYRLSSGILVWLPKYTVIIWGNEMEDKPSCICSSDVKCLYHRVVEDKLNTKFITAYGYVKCEHGIIGNDCFTCYPDLQDEQS